LRPAAWASSPSPITGIEIATSATTKKLDGISARWSGGEEAFMLRRAQSCP